MKNAFLGLGCISILVAAVACSGSHTTITQPNPDTDSSSSGAGGSSVGTSGAGGTASGAGAAGSAGRAGGSNSSACVTNSDCRSGACSGGQCVAISCMPKTSYCGAGGVWTCGADGTPGTLAQACDMNMFCVTQSGTATCSSTSCFAGDGLCVGNVATQCAPDGSGPKPGGTDCTQSKQTCYGGKCRDLVCTPGQKQCDNSTLYVCNDAGTSRMALSVCGQAEVCDEAMGACVPKVCDPGTLSCDASRVVTCNAAGSGYLQSGPDCALQKGSCVAGSCLPQVCAAGSSFCQGDARYVCNADGTASSLDLDCAAGGEHCQTYNSFAACVLPFCVANEASCIGNGIETCNATGTGWLSTTTDCGTTSTCLNAKCVPQVCTPDALFCKNGNIQACDDEGLTSMQAAFCGAGTTCGTRHGAASCEATPCTPGGTGCAAEKLGVCAADGGSVATVTQDCGAAKQVCTLQGCAATAIDVISTPSEVSTGGTGDMILDVLDVDSPRKITLLEAYLSLPAARSLIWVVYEATNTDGNGEFDLKFQVTTSATGAGFQSSGAISVELQAGKTYAIGVTSSNGSVVYYSDTPLNPPAVNFGHVVDSVTATFGSSFDYSQGAGDPIYALRLTSTTP